MGRLVTATERAARGARGNVPIEVRTALFAREMGWPPQVVRGMDWDELVYLPPMWERYDKYREAQRKREERKRSAKRGGPRKARRR